VAVDWLGFDEEYDVGECGVINNCTHIYDEICDCLVVDFVFFELADI
jgi:hypothetical protein